MAKRTALYPIFLNLAARRVLVVGGGPVAARKVRLLCQSGAETVLVAPKVSTAIRRMARGGRIVVHERKWQAKDAAGAWLVIAATDDRALNRAIATECARRRIFCNVVDDPALCTFQAPAVVRRGALQIAISTGGASPALAGEIRRMLEVQFGPEYAVKVEQLRKQRDTIKQGSHPPAARRRLLRAGARAALNRSR